MRELQPAIVQRWIAGHDVNGNPKRVFVFWAADGTFLDAIDEGYGGRPRFVRDLIDLGEVYVPSKQYRDILKMSPTNGSGFTFGQVNA